MTFAVAISLVSLVWQVLGAILLGDGRAEAAQASPEVLLRGQQVYAASCAVCHGASGDGNGMAAHMFRVRPRSFREGIFKFRSTPFGSLPTDDDLLRSVTQGLRWTGMVGRADLPEADRRAVVQFLKAFSPRFATEPPAPAVVVPTAPTEEPGSSWSAAATCTESSAAPPAMGIVGEGMGPQPLDSKTTGAGRPGRAT